SRSRAIGFLGSAPWRGRGGASDGDAVGSVRGPEAGEGFPVGALAELLERAIADLSDALPRHAEEGADLLERALLPVVESVVQIEDLPLPLGQIALEHRLEEVATS